MVHHSFPHQDRSPSDAASESSSSSSSSLSLPEKIEILYASETGNAQDTAERVGREIRRRGGRCTVQSMKHFNIAHLPHIPLVILITSTHGRGDPPPAMLPLWKALLRQGLPSDILEDVSFALYGLGDSSYEKFCYAGKILARRMLSLGANLVGTVHGSIEEQRLNRDLENAERDRDGGKGKEAVGRACLAWGDERAPDGIEETFIPWLNRTVEVMLPYLPTPPPSFEIYSPTSVPPPLYELSPATTTSNGVDSLDSNGGVITSLANRTAHLDIGAHRKAHLHHTLEDQMTPAILQKNRRVTPEGWWQDVREIELMLEDHTKSYATGAVCSLRPKSSKQEVDRFLQLMGLEEDANKQVIIRELCNDQPLSWSLPPAGSITTLRELLTTHLDLRASPRKSFFEWMRRFTPDDREQERLDEFIADPDEIHTYATRPSRTIVETLADFRATRIPLSHILEVLQPIRRRRFSIASSFGSHPGRVQLLIAMVDYKTNLLIRRQGLCSSWLTSLNEGAHISIGFEEPTLFLPEVHDTPVVLIGPGTGVAPMRAFAEERIRQGEGPNTVLYFGCRSRTQDLFFEHDWEEMERHGARVRIAPSRDQPEKIYVQDLIKQDAKIIHDWVYVRQGYVYISGSSNAMPKSVRAAIAWCISLESGVGSLPINEAEAYVDDMFELGGRGAEETW